MINSKEIVKEKSKQTFDKQAENYDSTYNGKHARRLYDDVIEKIIGLDCGKILDVGCGTGTILSILAENGELSLHGMDFSEAMIGIAKDKLGDRAELKISDSEKLPWVNDYFDAIICTDSFHHYPEPEKVLMEMARVLKAGGILIIGDPWMMAPLRQICNWTLKYSKEGDYRIYSKGEVTKLLSDSGFNSIEWRKVNKNAFLVTAKLIK